MKFYRVSFGAGLLVGLVYAALNVRSSAPSVVALIGLLGILIGEQLVPVARKIFAGEPMTIRWLKATCHVHVFGKLPNRSEEDNRQT